jgi:hypothetical protein
MGAAVSTIHVHLRCPSCGHEWHEATIRTDAWWGAVTPEQIAQQPWCQCGQAPPMTLTSHRDLFGGAGMTTSSHHSASASEGLDLDLAVGVVSENTERGTA